MADALVSPLVEVTIEKIGSYIRSQYTGWRNIKDDLTKLEETLEDIQMVVAAVERGQIMDQYQAKLLRQLKDAVYEADDVLDEFEYRGMEARAKKSRNAVRAITSSSLQFGRRLVGQDKLCNQLAAVLKKLQRLNQRTNQLIQLLGDKETLIRPGRHTSHIPPATRTFGRDEQKKKIVKLLMNSASEPESSDPKSMPFVSIVIVGIGGVGKTHLAQLIYNDKSIIDHFNLRKWVCVSDRFHDVTLAKEILGSTTQTSDFNTLQNELQTMVESKNFLLVLDDVWMNKSWSYAQNEELWKKLLAPLKAGKRGSKILVTTRMKEVADMFNEKDLISLEGLENDEYQKLFIYCAFGNENPDDHPELKQITKKIVEKLKGSPLAAKAVGSMLQSKFSIEEWNKILETRIFDDIRKVLNLSYEHLPDHLKYCFAYCSIFPKDWKFDRQKLAFLWVAQGYVQSRERDNRTEEEIGIDYFDELVSRSFFQIVEKDSSKSYVMHDLMHDLAEHVSYDECFRMDGGKQRSIGPSIRHIGVCLGWYEIEDVWSELKKMKNLKNLRTLIFVSYDWWDSIELPSWLREVRSLRVLGFDGVDGELKGDIGHLVHLRYLDVGHGYPWAGSLRGLFHLKVVFAEEQPLIYSKRMTELSAFGKLTHIFGETLEFVVGEERGGRDLKDVKLLRGGELLIKNVENVRSEVEAAEVGLEHQQFIEKLILQWGYSERRIVRHDSGEKVVDALKPHPNLKYLTIRNFGGRRCPSWLETNWLRNLQSLCLSDCKGLEVMPPLGHLPCLKNLKLWSMGSIERIGMEFYGDGNVKGFPSLEELEFRDMPALVEWSAPKFPVFPRLQRLWVDNCPKLKQFLSFPRAVEGLLALQQLEISNCWELKQFPSFPSLSSLGISSLSITDGCLSRWLQGLSSLSSLQIQDCNDLTSLPSAEVLHHLIALQEMDIYTCSELASLGGLHALPSLQKLSVTYCDKLNSLPEEGLPPSIKDINVYGCHPALEKQICEKEGPEWDKIAHILDVFLHPT